MADEARIPFTEHPFGGKLWQRFVNKSNSTGILSVEVISALESEINRIVRVSKQANAVSKEFRQAAEEAEFVIELDIEDKMSADLREAINPRLLRESEGRGGVGGAAAGGVGGRGADAAANRISAFLKALCDTEPSGSDKDVLEFAFDGNFAGFLGLHGFEGKDAVKFLCRKDYDEITQKIIAHFHKNSITSARVIVTGTSGVGKSLLRFYIIRKWLKGEVDLKCKNICINLFSGDSFFLIDKEGNVTPIVWNPQDYDTVALLDPCTLLESKDILFRLTIVTTSASHLAGEKQKCNLSEFGKLAKIYVLGLCPISDFKKMGLGVDPVRLEHWYSCTLDDKQYCVPRLLTYSGEDIEGQIRRSEKACTQQGLFEFFVSNKCQCVKDPRLPFRWCIIREAEIGNEWEASGFISDHVTEELLKWAAAGSQAKRERFLNMLENPFAKSLIGIWFENWAFGAMVSDKALHYNSTQVRFKSLEDFPGVQASARKREVEIQLETLYQALSRNCPSIDGFGMVDDKLIMVQMTVGRSHPPAKWEDIDYIVATAQKINAKVEAYLVYVINKNQDFVLPDCPTLKDKVNVVTGYINDDFYPYLSKKATGEVQTSDSVKLVVRRSPRLAGAGASLSGNV